eukprot:TRINITY_DN70389_c0_g1_i1.p1 TRINITY_DN70389_c0_g1~~TRINITY_DN70389_c0_g1_i1.p1  ORF type:complete len:241 (+),score=17.50 TRINITY_DN70389_c0_g1_i1:146-868(+)
MVIYLSVSFGGYSSYFFAILVIGCRMRALADILHQSSHSALSCHHGINKFLGKYPSGYMVLQLWTVYHSSHVINHHRYLGHPALDPDMIPLLGAGLYSGDVSAKRVLEFILSRFSLQGILEYQIYLCKDRILPRVDDPAKQKAVSQENKARLIYYASLLIALWVRGWLSLFFWYWVVPLCTSANIVGAVIELSEHYPLLRNSSRLQQSRNRICGPVVNFFFGIHWEGYHLVHHLYPRMPS